TIFWVTTTTSPSTSTTSFAMSVARSSPGRISPSPVTGRIVRLPATGAVGPVVAVDAVGPVVAVDAAVDVGPEAAAPTGRGPRWRPRGGPRRGGVPPRWRRDRGCA